MIKANEGYEASTDMNILLYKSKGGYENNREYLPRNITCIEFHPHYHNILVAAGERFYSVFKLSDIGAECIKKGDCIGTVKAIGFDPPRDPNFVLILSFFERPGVEELPIVRLPF